MELTWADQDTPTPVGSATVSLYRTLTQPATFTLGTLPTDLQGELIHSALEEETDNRFVWNLRGVPAGRWFVYSQVQEPPGQPGEASAVHIRFLPSVISTGVEVNRPTVFITRPANEFAVTAADQYRIEYCVTGATPVARVDIEAQPRTGGEPIVIAADLPASGEHSFMWTTEGFARGDWRLRATVQDCEGRRFSAWAPYFVFVAGEGKDAGVIGVPRVDAGWHACPQTADAGAADVRQTEDTGQSGAKQPMPSGDGCSCRQSRSAQSPLLLLLMAIVLRFRTRRRHY